MPTIAAVAFEKFCREMKSPAIKKFVLMHAVLPVGEV